MVESTANPILAGTPHTALTSTAGLPYIAARLAFGQRAGD